MKKNFIIIFIVLIHNLSLSGQELLFKNSLFHDNLLLETFNPFKDYELRYIAGLNADSTVKSIVSSNNIKSCFVLTKNYYHKNNDIEQIDSTYYSFNKKGQLIYYHLCTEEYNIKEEYFYNNHDQLEKTVINDSLTLHYRYDQNRNLINNSIINTKGDSLKLYHYLYDQNNRIEKIIYDRSIWEYKYAGKNIIVYKNNEKYREINKTISILRRFRSNGFSTTHVYEIDGNIYRKGKSSFLIYTYSQGVLKEYFEFKEYDHSKMSIAYNEKGLVELLERNGVSHLTKFSYNYKYY